MDPAQALEAAFRADDAALVRRLLAQHPELEARINEPAWAFDSPPILHARSRGMLDVLLEAGADLDAKSRWWAGGFGLLHCAAPDLAAYAIERGALVDVHAAARLGRIDRLRELISADPASVAARGGDGQTPLHFSATTAVAELLLDHGADIDARDVDHESTPAQYMARNRQEVARLLVARGAVTDLLLASALGDEELVRRYLDRDPDSIRMRVSDDYFPKADARSGGTIYQWELGWHVSAHDVARQFGHEHVLRLLMERSPIDVTLLAACWGGDEATVKALVAGDPDLVAGLSEADRRQIAHAARNNDLSAVRSMLAAGLPVDARGQHGATALHWAGFHGNAAMAREILRHDPPLELVDTDHGGTPLAWTLYGSEHGWDCRNGNYAATAEAMLQTGARLPESIGGTEAVRAVLRRHGSTD